MNTSETTTNLLIALLKARKAFPKIKTDKVANTGKFSYNYASFPHILEECEPSLHANDLLVLQPLCRAAHANHVGVETRVVHVPSGEWMAETFDMPLDSGGSQGVGIAISYGRRYSFNAFMNIFPDDDVDGAAPGKKAKENTSRSPAMIAWNALPPKQQAELTTHAVAVIDYLNDDLPLEAVGYIDRKVPEPELQAALWSRFDSAQRSAMKAADAARRSNGGAR